MAKRFPFDLVFAVLVCLEPGSYKAVLAQVIPANDGTGTRVEQTGNQFEIYGGTLSQDGINLFQSFEQLGLDAGQIANFLVTPEIQNILGRVVGGDPSYINGLLQVSGGDANLFLINPAGIVFGADASLNVPGSFTATTANAIGFGEQNWMEVYGENSWATLVGTPDGFRFDALVPGSVVNLGDLTVAAGESLTLLGGTVINTGTLAAPGGTITAIAVPGQRLVRLQADGYLLSLDLPMGDSAYGDLPQAATLPELLTGGNASSADTVTVDAEGRIVLTSSGTAIPDTPGTAIASGSITVSSPQGTEDGQQSVRIWGDRVGLVDAAIDASGISGGTVFIGGDFKGQGTAPRADLTYIDVGTTIRADGLAVSPSTEFATPAQGGLVVVWSEEATEFYGNISARGGANGGNGGLVELSSRDRLIVRGAVDVGAETGAVGTLLLDPQNIVVIDGSGGTQDPELADGQILQGDSPAATFTISETALEDLSASANVVLEATENITINDLSDDELEFAGGTGGAIAFTADADRNGVGSFTADATDTIRTEGRSLTITGASVAVGSIDTSADLFDGGAIQISATAGGIAITGVVDSTSGLRDGGAIALTAPGNITTGSMISGSLNGSGGNITLISTGGTINTTAGVSFTAEQVEALTGNLIAITGTDTLTGLISGSLSRRGGNIELRADGNLITANLIASGLGVLASADPSIPQSGNITIASANGAIDTTAGQTFTVTSIFGDRLQSQEVAGLNASATADTAGGTITLSAGGNIATSDIYARSETQPGGTIALTSRDGAIATGTLDSSGNTGGSIVVTAPGTITTGAIAARGTVGNGGTIQLASGADLQVLHLNAQGGDSGTGGMVMANARQFFRATGTFLERNGIAASIAASGGTDSGSATITHGGGSTDPVTPLVVGDASINGLAGAIVTGTDVIASGSYPEPFTQGNIQLITQTPPPVLEELEEDILPVDPPPESLSEPAEPESTGGQLFTVEQVGDLNQRLVDLDSQFTNEYATYLALQPERAIVSLSEVQALLQGIEQEAGAMPAVLYAAFLKGLNESPDDPLQLLLVTATGDPVGIILPSITRKDVQAAVYEFRSQVTDPRRLDRLDYLLVARQLYDWLIAPVANTLEERGVENISFLLDETLRSLPVALLHDGDRFLIETYSVGLMPSLSLTDTRYVSLQGARVLAMGASEFQNQSPLPAVPVEVRAIAEKLWQGEVLLNEAFTTANLKSARDRTPYGIIHLATHADFRPGSASDSYIQFWGEERVGLDRVRSLELNDPPVRLLVLSACRTAVGDPQAELGYGGLAVAAGVNTALASLWYVSDIGTLGLMLGVYHHLQTSPTKAEAIRQAQLDMLEGRVRLESGNIIGAFGTVPLPETLTKSYDRELTHPFYWAGFSTIGSPW